MPRTFPARPAFTLIELLVVVAVISILIGILLPALGRARVAAQQIQAANNARSVAQGVASYTAANEFFPPSYVYGSNETGLTWRVQDQLGTNPTLANGYVHWSWALFEGSETAGDSFKSPRLLNSGAPATNPGGRIEDWEPWQTNDLGNGPGADRPSDRQVKRCAFTGNAALFPRNKFNSGQRRNNQLVKVTLIGNAARTILVGEFSDAAEWKSLTTDGTARVVKSHRPVMPFKPRGGSNIYAEPIRPGVASFKYPEESDILKDNQLGEGLIENALSELNVIGRHWPGGKANFAFVDGHVETKTVLETVRERLWGERVYSITGDNRVLEPDRANTNN